MKKVLAAALIFITFQSANALNNVAVHIESPRAGIDFPTERPAPNVKVLVAGENRILVSANAKSARAKAGIDFPTDRPVPAGRVIVIDGIRALLTIERAKAGIDFLTDGPPSLNRDFLVWSFSEYQRVPLARVKEIVRAEPGIDFPTDAPVRSNFLVLVTIGDERIQLN